MEKDEKLMKEKLIEKLYDFWKQTDDDKDKLLKEIETNVNDKKDGAEVLLDWCRCDYDYCKNTYMEIHSLNKYEMEKIMEEHLGDYTFMYEEVPYASELEEIWNLCNCYLDYCNEKNEERKKYYFNSILTYIYM